MTSDRDRQAASQHTIPDRTTWVGVRKPHVLGVIGDPPAKATAVTFLHGSRSSAREQLAVLDQPQSQDPAASLTAEDMTAGHGSGDPKENARRFRDAALPHLDDVYTLARYLLRDSTDAEDAVQECYLRAMRHFDTYRGPAMKPWLLAILRNVCRAEFMRRSGSRLVMNGETEEDEDAAPLWQEAPVSPETEMLRRHDAATIRRLVAGLPDPFREILVLREINQLSYDEIADVIGVPVGTVMSRLARARSMLRRAWITEEGPRS